MNGWRWVRSWAVRATAWPARIRTAAWYAVFAVFALPLGVFSGLPVEREWGYWAAPSYTLAGLAAALWPRRGQFVALTIAVAGALGAPLVWLVTGGRHMSTVGEGALMVVARAGTLLAHHGSPYLPLAQLSGPQSYNPYGPALAVFGLPGALGAPGWTGDPRLWLTLTGLVGVWLSFRLAAGGTAAAAVGERTAAAGGTAAAAGVRTAFAAASPLLALPTVAGGTDLPLLGLLCLALALATRGLPVWAGVTLGIACAMKSTAWPAIAVLFALFAAACGGRAARRFGLACLAAAVAGVLACAPAALAAPASLVRNTVLFPLGETHRVTTAASPLPGHLLASTGTAGRAAVIALLTLAVAAVCVWLVRRPPARAAAAVGRLALLYAVIFTLAPATRWGYFGYPLGLLGWHALTRSREVPVALPGADWPAVPGSSHGHDGLED